MAESGLCPRARLVIALALAFGIAGVKGVAVLPVLAALAVGVALLSGQAGRVVRRLRGAAPLALGVMLIVPLVSGQTVLAQIGPFAWRLEGMQAGAVMAVRLLSIVTLTIALLAPLTPFQLVGALRGLGLPALMADLALLTLRYLEETRAELRRARLAQKLRGGRGGWRALPDHAGLLATGLIRAQARAERLWAAMRLRGYGTGFAMTVVPLRVRDWAAMSGAMSVALGVFWLDRLL